MSELYVPQGAKQFNEKAIRQIIESQGWIEPIVKLILGDYFQGENFERIECF